MKLLARSLLLCAVLATSLPALLAQYSWIDNKGHRVFSDQPPPANIPKQNIITQHTASAASTGIPAAVLLPASAASDQAPLPEAQKEAASTDTNAAVKKEAHKQKLAAQRADNCQRAKTALAGLQSGVHFVQYDVRGQRFYITDKDRASEIQHMQSIIESNCR